MAQFVLLSPSDPPADTPVTWTLHPDAGGHFEVGTYAQAAVNALAVSLPYLRRLGADTIEAYRRPLLARLHEEMPRLGFASITPPESPSALVAFTMTGAERRFGDRLKAANVAVSLYGDRIRISPFSILFLFFSFSFFFFFTDSCVAMVCAAASGRAWRCCCHKK